VLCDNPLSYDDAAAAEPDTHTQARTTVVEQTTTPPNGQRPLGGDRTHIIAFWPKAKGAASSFLRLESRPRCGFKQPTLKNKNNPPPYLSPLSSPFVAVGPRRTPDGPAAFAPSTQHEKASLLTCCLSSFRIKDACARRRRRQMSPFQPIRCMGRHRILRSLLDSNRFLLEPVRRLNQSDGRTHTGCVPPPCAQGTPPQTASWPLPFRTPLALGVAGCELVASADCFRLAP
jgi:hypothetical protein